MSGIYSSQQVEELVSSNMGLVFSIVKSLRPSNDTELDEYVQLGRIGLWKAITKYNPNKKTKLSTFAWLHIRWEILRYMNKATSYTQCIDNNCYFEPPSYNPPPDLWEILPDSLSKSERITVTMRNQGHTFQEIATELGGYTRAWASKQFNSALKKIQYANK